MPGKEAEIAAEAEGLHSISQDMLTPIYTIYMGPALSRCVLPKPPPPSACWRMFRSRLQKPSGEKLGSPILAKSLRVVR